MTRPVFRAALAASLSLGFAHAAQALSEPPFSFDTAYGRLPKTVVPLDYRVEVTPDAEARSLSGKETVTLQFRQASATIVFNSLNETLADVRLDGKPVKSVISSNEQQLTTVTLNKPAAAGRHLLKFSYTGKMEAGPRGMFAQPYVKPDGGKGLLVSTKFESTDARRMFPCWDEPAFRSTFELSAVIPKDWAAVSNMPIATRVTKGELATVTFQRSPKMPTYLMEFTTGDLASIAGESRGTRLGIWAVRGQEQDGAEALANAQQILADYNDYFGFPFPLPKLDSIAIPGGFSGAMENWGAITYNDQLLLITPSSTLHDKQEVFSVQAHEMAHQWNGDLVTMGWWDDIWLNESFATWRSTKETDERHPDWKWWEIQDESKEGAMAADARVTSHAIQTHVVDELQVTNAFDPQITYSKGEAVLRMFEAYLGPDTFRAGVRGFMKAHAFSNATSTDLWNALGSASKQDVGAIAANWIEQPGFPLVSVSASCDADGKRSIALTQQRFLLRGSDPKPSHWSVPLQLRSGNNGPAQALLLTQDSQTVAAGRCDQPLTLSAGGIGFYRTAYDAATLQANTQAFATLPDADRITLLDDQWALVESGRQPLGNYLALASDMGDDLDERAWQQIAEALGTIEYDERGTPGHDAYAAYARTVLKPVADRLGWDSKPDETPGIQKLRRTVLGDLGSWGDPQVIAEARQRFAAFVKDHGSIRPDDQEFILAIVARNADAATFEQLHAVAKSAGNETELRRYYTALMLVREPQLAAQSAQIALSPEIPPQANAARLRLIAALDQESPQLAWTTFTQNVDALMLPQGRYGPLIVAQFSPELFWNSAPLDQIESWVKAHTPAEMADNVARGMESARFKFDEKTALVGAADDYLKNRKS
jgi:aminopeptidase N